MRMEKTRDESHLACDSSPQTGLRVASRGPTNAARHAFVLGTWRAPAAGVATIAALALDFEEWLEGWDRWTGSLGGRAEQRSVLVDGDPMCLFEDASAHGTPLLLLHSLDPLTSSVEMRRLFELFRHERPVVAVDLPGFGLSSRDTQAEVAPLLLSAVEAALEDTARRFRSSVHVVAARGSCHLAWAVAAADAERVSSLTLISPTPSAAVAPAPRSATARSPAPLSRLLSKVRESERKAIATDASLRSLDRARGYPLSMPAHLIHDGQALDPRWLGALGRLPAWEVTCMPAVSGHLHTTLACSMARAMRPFLADIDEASRSAARQPP
jgi:pimeloyl-ACP methyl ester carboxylesterase